MNTPIATDAKFRERSGVNSLVIARPNFPNYGVIFTTSENPSAEEFDTKVLIGALIEHVKKAGELEDPFYRILGGYFYTPDGNGGGTVQKVFGIAGEADKGFELSNGGDSNIGTDWTTMWKTTKFLKEGVPVSATEPAQKGWTFITEPKYGNKVFPLSRDPLAIHIVCPKIISVTPVYGKPSPTTQPVTLEIEREDGLVQEMNCNWGDGSRSESLEAPFTSPSHLYKRIEETQIHIVVVDLSGYGSCESKAETEVQIPSLNCPTIKDLEIQSTLEAKKLTVNASVSWNGDQPDSIMFDWGDGHTSQGNNASHEYARPVGDALPFVITAKMAGPGSCQSRSSESIIVPGICPKIETLSLEYLTQTENSQEVRATVSMKEGIMAERYVWDWGNGEAEITGEPTATITYDRTNSTQDFAVVVQALGPGRCATRVTEKATIIPIPKPGCAKITQLIFKVDDPVNGKVKVHAEVQWEGGHPTQVDFDWGDNTQSKDVNATVASHEYPQAFGNYDAYEVTVHLSGPNDCEDSHSEKVKIPATPCGKFDAVKVLAQSATDTAQTVKASVSLSGPEPDTITWDWGDGSPVENGGLSASHTYQKAAKARQLSIKVAGTGPGDCATEASASHTVPAKKAGEPEPEPQPEPISGLCLWMPYIVAFLSALTLGHLVVMLIALNDGSAAANAAVFATVGSVILLAIAVYFWYQKCDPTRCAWLATGWVSIWASLMPLFRSMECVGENPLVPGIIGFVLGAGFAFLWFRSCAPASRARTFVLYFVAMVAAALIAGLATTALALNC